MPHTEASTIIRAPREEVVRLYSDYRAWPDLFPATIRNVRVVRSEAGRTELEIGHRDGKVPNVMTRVSESRIDLWEDKRRYEGRFVNRFETVPEGTLYTVEADITLKGVVKILDPLLGPYIRRQIGRYVLTPVRAAAEAHRDSAPGGA